MLIADFLLWWYGPGWLGRLVDVERNVSRWAHYFSLGTLLATLFQPWKQIVTQTGAGQSLKARESAFIDNIVSRFVGFFVRIGVFVCGVFFMIAVMLFSLLFVILWPVLPVSPLLVIVVGLGA